MKSIVMVTNNYTPYSGGVVSSIISFRDELVRQGYTVHIVTLDFLGAAQAPEEGVIRIPCPITFPYKNNIMAVPWLPDRAVARIIAQIKPDIIHTHHPFLLGVSGLRAGRRLGIPLVFTHHTYYERYAHYVPLVGRLSSPVITKLVRAYCMQVDGIIAPSASVAHDLSYLAGAVPVRVIPSGLLPVYAPQAVYTKKVSSPCPVRLLSVSRFTKEKEVDRLITVYAQLAQRYPGAYTLTLIGYGSELPALRRYAYQTLGLHHDQVQFIEKPSREIIARWYRQADIFLYASTSETQGLVLVEAMAGGTPVIAFDGSGQRDIIVPGNNGFLVRSVDEMIAMINAVAGDNQLWQGLCAGAWHTAQEYTIAQVTRALVDFYEAVCVSTKGL